jgi:putative membrane protein
MRSLGFATLLCAVALTTACNSDRRSTTARSDNATAVGTSGETVAISNADKDFVHDLMVAGNAEIQLGNLASSRAGKAEVKEFGQQMVKDHTAAGDQLNQIATRSNVDAGAAAIDDKHQQLITKLSALKGADFDREYMKAMVDGHQDVLDKLQKRVDEKDRVGVATGQKPKDVNVKPEKANDSFEASLNQWAADTLPVVKGHLEKAKAVKEAVDRGRNNTASNR